ncbi:potassium transporter Kup [Niveibacterium umoris]|uniref:Probable potassium transport system protein Kup n=1 Tax=Niveibacterium umoris TaxID=1193620 RepID=A0A840BDD4_9RHOO|nr:potassium transporter Kup [Niveibacterium umoris]MBB4011040.1 KUP system potassium uptake protein [Niveibacterium umoris]
MSHGNEQVSTRALTLAALGVVFGDIGTSPLYALKEAFTQESHPLPPTPDNILGILSLIVWTLLIVVTFKYVVLVLRADNHGEGGVVALMARVIHRAGDSRPRKRAFAIALGLAGAALFYGDGVITPAISVLSAVEGLEVATPAATRFVVPITVVILVGLFFVQKHGTAKVGQVFGPILALWFSVLFLLGLYNIGRHPEVLLAVSPHYAVRFLIEHGTIGFLALGAVFLTVTGAEALYADMGHFGARPIRIAWSCFVLPGLLSCYFGQGALLMSEPEAIRNPFFLSAPDWAIYPLVGLATVASVIASQALISGVYSVTREMIQLGVCPRISIQHTSGAKMGQIYVPFMNWTLMVLVLAVVLGFRTSSNLAGAYGIAVSMTMVITSILAFSLVRRDWKWPTWVAVLVWGPLLMIELAFLAANATKILDGGWFPLLFGGFIFMLLSTWRRGRELLRVRSEDEGIPLEPFIEGLVADPGLARVPSEAVFLSPRSGAVPRALLHNLKHNMVLHETTVFASVVFMPQPRVQAAQRVLVERMAGGCWRVKLFFGFMEDPDVPAALEWCAEQELALDPMRVSYFLSRETLLPTEGEGMALWRERVFEFLFRNATSAASFFKLPPNRVVELGSQIAI